MVEKFERTVANPSDVRHGGSDATAQEVEANDAPAGPVSAVSITLGGMPPSVVSIASGTAVTTTRVSDSQSLSLAAWPHGELGTVLKRFGEQQRGIDRSLMLSLAGRMDGVVQTARWNATLAQADKSLVSRIFGQDLGGALDGMRASMAQTAAAAFTVDRNSMAALMGVDARLRAELDGTRLKLAALAGAGEVHGASSRLRYDLYRTVFGDWHSRPGLPRGFWRDARVRRRVYREAEVDEGLMAATPSVALEIVVESGLVAGLRSDTETEAVLTLGEVSMKIRSRSPRMDAYAALSRFERELRGHVARRLEDRFGPDWFKSRAANLVGKAKEVRFAALKRGEPVAPLIDFVDLGDLAGIVLSTRNWAEVFSDIFVNRSEFELDMQKVVALRRPTMHIRPIDAVRLVEMICVMLRLSKQMADDGAWKIAAQSDC